MSRELDREVAEKVMGGCPQKVCTYITYTNSNGELQKDPIFEDALEALPHYSTDIYAAWRVVERLKTPARRIEISTPMGDQHWVCQVFESGGIIAGAGADTAPEAICRAALKAVGHDL